MQQPIRLQQVLLTVAVNCTCERPQHNLLQLLVALEGSQRRPCTPRDPLEMSL